MRRDERRQTIFIIKDAHKESLGSEKTCKEMQIKTRQGKETRWTIQDKINMLIK